MVREILLVVVFIVSVCMTGMAQSNSSDDTSEESSTSTKVEEEVVDGFWSVSAYLGKKLINGMSERLNLDEEGEKQEAPKKKVTLKLGSFEIERIEGG